MSRYQGHWLLLAERGQKAVDKSERNGERVRTEHITKFHLKPFVTMLSTRASKPDSGAVRSFYLDTEDLFS